MKKVIVIPALLGAMGIGGALALSSNLVGSADSSASDSNILSVAEVKKKALETVNGKIVEIETKDAEYELKIDALTGDVLKNKKELHDDDDDWDNDWDDDRYDD